MSVHQSAKSSEARFAMSKVFCSAVLLISCAESPVQYAAYGHLTPGPSPEPKLIGVYMTRSACNAAATDWMSRQVVGNPIYAECLPVEETAKANQAVMSFDMSGSRGEGEG